MNFIMIHCGTVNMSKIVEKWQKYNSYVSYENERRENKRREICNLSLYDSFIFSIPNLLTSPQVALILHSYASMYLNSSPSTLYPPLQRHANMTWHAIQFRCKNYQKTKRKEKKNSTTTTKVRNKIYVYKNYGKLYYVNQIKHRNE